MERNNSKSRGPELGMQEEQPRPIQLKSHRHKGEDEEAGLERWVECRGGTRILL